MAGEAEMADIPALTDDEWSELLERLAYHAARKFQKCGWRRGHRTKCEWAAPGGSSPQDVALEAIVSTISGDRTYNRDRYPDFAEFLRSVVDSMISHMVEKANLQRTGRIPVVRDAESQETVEVDLPGDAPDPSDVVVSREVIELARAAIEADAEKDPLVLQMFECLEADITKPAEIAEFLDVDVKKVYSAQKRLRRKLDRAFARDRERER